MAKNLSKLFLLLLFPLVLSFLPEFCHCEEIDPKQEYEYYYEDDLKIYDDFLENLGENLNMIF